MAATWLPGGGGVRERLPVQRGVTVAKSQTHALYTIEVLLMKSALRSQVGAAGDGQTCDQWGGGGTVPTLTGHICLPVLNACRVSDTRGRGRAAQPFSI